MKQYSNVLDRPLSKGRQEVFATLSPLPGYMQWLLSKLASQLKLLKLELKSTKDFSKKDSCSILEEEEEKMILNATKECIGGKTATEVLYNLLTSTKNDWTKSDQLLAALQPLLMHLSARDGS